jgi:hypothetical protein
VILGSQFSFASAERFIELLLLLLIEQRFAFRPSTVIGIIGLGLSYRLHVRLCIHYCGFDKRRHSYTLKCGAVPV